MSARRNIAALVVLLLLTGCGPQFLPGDRIERTRIVAARAHAAGDPTRAWVLPGEHATIEYLIVSTLPTSDAMRTSFVACNQASMAGLNGVTGCEGPMFDAANADVPAAMVPTLIHTFHVPSDVVPSFSTNLLTYLGTCIGSAEPVVDPTQPGVSCAGSERSELYQFPVQIIPDLRLANHNPNIHDERYFIDDLLWTEPQPDVPAVGCASLSSTSSLPTVRMAPRPPPYQPSVYQGESPLLTFGCTADDREMYPAFDADMNPVIGHEHIDINHYVSLGRISSSTRIDDDDPLLTASTRWTRPIWEHHSNDMDDDLILTDQQKTDVESGILVRFWFVARDGRGGSDWVERDLCLTTGS